MKFFIYHRPLTSIRGNENIGTLIHVSLTDRDYSPDGEVWRKRGCNRSEVVYNRLTHMLKHGGMGDDGIYPLSEERTIDDLIAHINSWRK